MSWFDGDLTYKQMLLTNKFRSGAAMKTSPTKPSMTFYTVTIDGESFDTTASNPNAAISKCAYKFAFRHGERVELVQYNIRNGKIRVHVKEG